MVGKAVNRNKPEDLPDKLLIATLSGERQAEYIRHFLFIFFWPSVACTSSAFQA
jgi:hypothetical protein